MKLCYGWEEGIENMSQDLGISLREILKHPSLKHAKLIAGAGGLDKIVKYVNIMEVPDILDWVKEGELLLTTVYAIRNDIGAQSRLIPELAAKKLAGLAIKPGRYIEKIPDIMVEQAEMNNLPLLELHSSASFSDIINQILSEILNKQAIIMKRADEVHVSLTQVVLEGGDLPEIAHALSELLNNNLVVIETCMDSTVIAPQSMQELASNITLMTDCNILQTTRGKVKLADRKQLSYVRTPICVSKKYYGTITVFEANSQISARDELAVERAATTAALALVNRLAVTAVERRYCSEFINEMLGAEASLEKKIWQQAKRLGINIGESHTVIVLYINKNLLQVKAKSGEDAEWEEARQLLFQQIVEALRTQFPELAIGCKFDSLVIFVPKAEATEKALSKLGEHVRRKSGIIDPNVRVLIGIGREGAGLVGLQTSYREALQAYRIGKNIWTDSDTYYFDALGIWRLLGSIPDSTELQTFVNETVGPIVAYDRDKGTELLKTLETYFECNGNLKRVAEKMFTHYNTVLYRMERIMQIAGVDLNNSSNNLNLHIGLKILKILDM